MMQAVSFQQILQILTVTDEMDISREAVDIPLTPESPGVVRRLPNGKLEIVVDADLPFEEWLQRLEPTIQGLLNESGEEH
ncbi:MAG: hypothetical protein KC563_01040 [Nitrospira sp.]|nr:hypothetical protein [Nitrospira sp.]MCA9467636.1 hypothetical protein [Nitrospira sp.]MCA9474386.1 hypothetical protein [Nitrospira sp.]MCA9478748.1 hypothetical protein [Nitrospira sp.]MDR4487487.1 hypothetical protein [Nitrospirales bacterium]